MSDEDPITVMRRRLARHWLTRLRRRNERAAIEEATGFGVLETVERKDAPTRFVIGQAVVGWTLERIGQLLRRAFGHRPPGMMSDAEVIRKWGLQSGVSVDWEDDLDNDEHASTPVLASESTEATSAVSAATDDDDLVAVELTATDEPAQVKPRVRKPKRETLPRPGEADRLQLLAMVRSHAAPLATPHVAALLMLADAMARSGYELREVLAILRRPKPIIALTGAPKGFEPQFYELMMKGLVLPGTTAMLNGSDYRLNIDPRLRDGARRVVIFFAGREADRDANDANVERQVGLAMRSPYPVLAIGDHDEEVPAVLQEVADLDLSFRPVTPDLLVETIKVVLGLDEIRLSTERQSMELMRRAPQPPSERSMVTLTGERAAEVFEGCEVLTLGDLTLAIRPGLAAEHCVELLQQRIARRQASFQKSSGSEQKDKASGHKAKSKDSNGSRRGRVGTGSTLLQPEPLRLKDGKPPAFVETLVGYGKAQDWGLNLKADVALWKAGSLPWSDMSTRLLLAGPPGTGKTTYARALSNTLELPLLATSVGRWLEASYLGDVLARMSAAFEEATANAPCILFIDEIDGLGKRGNGDRRYDDYWNSVVNRALELLDGAVRTEGVILVGATNHPSAIDSALLRSGRLETRIDIELPDVDALVGILQHHLGEDVAGVVDSRPTADAVASEQGDCAEPLVRAPRPEVFKDRRTGRWGWFRDWLRQMENIFSRHQRKGGRS